MTTFANKPVTYPDGQSSVIPFPEEVYERGFFPPVQTPDGGVVKGDVLPSPWLNKLFQLLFWPSGPLLPDSALPDVFETGSTEGRQGWMGINVGPLTLEIGAYRFATTAAGSQNLQFGTTFKAGTKPLIMMIDLTDPASAAGAYAIWGNYASASHNNAQAPTGARSIARSGDTGLPGTFLYMVMGERDVTTNQMAIFCNKPQTFIDGQTSLSAPSNDQIAFGFVPPVMSGSLVQDGDTIPANILNYLFRDLTTIAGNFYWEIGGTVDARSYRIVFGTQQLQAFRKTVPAGSPAANYSTITYPWPFASDAVAAGLFNIATPTGTAKAAIAQAVAVSNTQLRATVRYIDAANSAPNGGGVADFFSLGKAATPAPSSPMITSLPGFAMSQKTYADGQDNKTKPSTAIMDAGFSPPYKNASGTIIGGDLVTANEINWLFDEAYKTLLPGKITTGSIAADAAKKIQGGWWITIGDLLIQYFWTNVATTDWSGGVRKQPYAMPVKLNTKPFILPVVVSADEQSFSIVTVGSKTTDTDVDIGGIWNHSGAAVTSVATSIQYLIIGKKP